MRYEHHGFMSLWGEGNTVTWCGVIRETLIKLLLYFVGYNRAAFWLTVWRRYFVLLELGMRHFDWRWITGIYRFCMLRIISMLTASNCEVKNLITVNSVDPAIRKYVQNRSLNFAFISYSLQWSMWIDIGVNYSQYFLFPHGKVPVCSCEKARKI